MKPEIKTLQGWELESNAMVAVLDRDDLLIHERANLIARKFRADKRIKQTKSEIKILEEAFEKMFNKN